MEMEFSALSKQLNGFTMQVTECKYDHENMIKYDQASDMIMKDLKEELNMTSLIHWMS